LCSLPNKTGFLSVYNTYFVQSGESRAILDIAKAADWTTAGTGDWR